MCYSLDLCSFTKYPVHDCEKERKDVDAARVGPLIEKAFVKTIYSAPERCCL